MPTPLVHVFVSQRILSRLAGAPAAMLLEPQAGDFFLGSTAPDAWSLGGVSRQQAHMVPVPMPADQQGARELLQHYPELRSPASLSPAKAAFVAGYMTHLMLDELWYHQIFIPFFGLDVPHPPLRRRLMLHNVLRLYLENQLEPMIEPAHSHALAQAKASYQLDFMPDHELRRWRDLIAEELQPGAQKRSVEVFASRLQVPPREMLALLDDDEELEREILCRLPESILDRVIDEGIRRGVILVMEYLDNSRTRNHDLSP